MMRSDTPGPFRRDVSPEAAAAHWQCLADAVPDILLLLDPDGRIMYVNRDLPGLARDTVAGTSVFGYLPAEAEGELRASLAAIFAGGLPRSRELPITTPDGDVRWFATHTGAVTCFGETMAAAVVARDVTEQRRVDAALRESEARYRTLVENAPEAIVVLDVDHRRFVDANSNACRLFGLERELLLESNPVRLSPYVQPDGTPSATAADAWIRDALGGGVPVFDWMHRSSAGDDLRCEVRLVRLPSDDRKLIRGSITDVTLRRRMDDQMQQLQKMEAIGQLAGGIAHDFNNVLAVVSGAAELIARELPPSEPLRTQADSILSATRSGASLTRQLLTFARRQVVAPAALDLNQLVEDVVIMIERLLGDSITVKMHLDPADTRVFADRGRMEQVVMNLLLNARDAMPAGGTIAIRTAVVTSVRSLAQAQPRPGEWSSAVSLSVEDTGIGMDDDTRRRVFEPFFTTKPEGQGTGLGLAMVYGIVKECGGTIDVRSLPGAGSTFEIMLPRLRRER